MNYMHKATLLLGVGLLAGMLVIGGCSDGGSSSSTRAAPAATHIVGTEMKVTPITLGQTEPEETTGAVDALVLADPSDITGTAGVPISETLPVATGGSGSYTYTVTGLPTELRFTASTRVVSGTVTGAATSIATYQVEDSAGTVEAQTFSVTLKPVLALPDPSDITGTAGIAISETLPVATGGSGPYTYTVTGLPAELSFTASTRVVSGTVTSAATTIASYQVTDSVGTVKTQTFTVTLNSVLSLPDPSDITGTAGIAISETLPVATGGSGPYTYTVTGLPTGLGFTASTRVVSGTVTSAATTIASYQVTDSAGTVKTQTFTVTLNSVLSLPGPSDITGTAGIAISETLPVATGGSGPYTYTVTGLPTGLGFTASTRVVSGTVTSAATTIASYQVTDSAGTVKTQTFTVTLNPVLSLPAPSDITGTAGIAISETLPVATGGSGSYAYAVTGLPTGLGFTASTRVVSGTVNTVTSATTIASYQVTDSAGTVKTQTFTVTLNAVLSLPAPSDITGTEGIAISETLPVATGGSGSYAYTVTDLPTGLGFTASTRVVSGTVNTVTSVATTIASYQVKDSAGTLKTQTFSVTIKSIPPTIAKTDPEGPTGAVDEATGTVDELLLPDPNHIARTAGIPISETLPVATGGSGPYTYTVTDLPTGLSFNAGTREVSGAGAAVTSITTTIATYQVEDSAGTVKTQTFSVTLYPAPSLPAPSDITGTAGVPISETLPEATGGRGYVNYAVTGLPRGLDFTANTGEVRGTVASAGETEATYQFSDFDSTITALFTVTVNDAPPAPLSLPIPSDITVVTSISGLILPVATGGSGSYAYTVTGLPTGLIFTAGTRVVSGTVATVTSAVTTIATYQVEDSDGTVKTQTFSVTLNPVLSLPVPSDITGTVSENIGEVLPAAIGGIAPYAYTVTGLPRGLRFDATRRVVISSTGNSGISTATYQVTDSAGTVRRQTFTVTINRPPTEFRSCEDDQLLTNLQSCRASGLGLSPAPKIVNRGGQCCVARPSKNKLTPAESTESYICVSSFSGELRDLSPPGEEAYYGTARNRGGIISMGDLRAIPTSGGCLIDTDGSYKVDSGIIIVDDGGGGGGGSQGPCRVGIELRDGQSCDLPASSSQSNIRNEGGCCVGNLICTNRGAVRNFQGYNVDYSSGRCVVRAFPGS